MKFKFKKVLVLVFFAIFVFNSTLFVASASTNDDQNNILGRGVDVVKASYGNQYDNKTELIFNKSWLNNQEIVTILDGGSLSHTYSNSGTDITNMYNRMSSSYSNISSLKGIKGPFSAGMSIGYKGSSEHQLELFTHNYYYHFNYNKILYTKHFEKSPIAHKSEYQNGLSSSFQGSLYQLVNNIAYGRNPQAEYENLFNRFGTHFITNAVYGAKADVYYNVSSNEVSFTGSTLSQLNAEVNGAMSTITEGGDISNDTSIELENVVGFSGKEYRSEFNSVITNGPSNISILDFNSFRNGFTLWASNITHSNSGLIGYGNNGLYPIWDMLPNTYSYLSDDMEAAFKVYAEKNFVSFTKAFTPITKMTSKWSVVQGQEVRVFSGKYSDNPGNLVNINNRFNYDLQGLKEHGFTHVQVFIKFQMKEIQDGYQHIAVFKQANPSPNFMLDSMVIEHGGPGRDENWRNYSLDPVFKIEELMSSYPFDDSTFGIFWKSSGILNWNDFKVRNIRVAISVSKNEEVSYDWVSERNR